MKVITDVTVLNIPDDERMVIKYNGTFMQNPPDDCFLVEPMKEETESLTGETFMNAKGEKIYLGLCKQAESLLGLPFEVFQKMSKELDGLRYSFKINEDELYKFQYMGFWKRLKYLFTGKL